MTTDRKTMTTSQMIASLQHCLQQNGDRPVYFTDGFHRYGANCHAESAPNFSSPQAVLVKAFNLETGIDEFEAPVRAAKALYNAADSLMKNEDFFNLVVNGHLMDDVTKLATTKHFLDALPAIYEKHRLAIKKVTD